MSKRLNQQRQQDLEPGRIKHAIKMIESFGYTIHYQDDKKIAFIYKENVIMYYPYSGWHTGKGITDGRGLYVLLKQIKP